MTDTPTLFDDVATVAAPALPADRNMRFDGSDYEPSADQPRLSGQLARIFGVMSDGAWRTLDEIARSASAPAASVSAQLRHLRKPRFGAHIVEKRPRGDRSAGLWEYRVLVRDQVRGGITREAECVR